MEDIVITYEYCCKRIWADIKTKDKKKVRELWKILDDHGLETWDKKKLEWEGEIEFYTFKKLLKELERHGYKVKYEIDY